MEPYHTRAVRGVVRGGDGVPFMPWIQPKNSSWYPSGRSIWHSSALYQEFLLVSSLQV
jgi:hypothetical protein